MSFGFSISDIITLTQLTTRTYSGWKKACGEYASITCDLAVLQTLLMQVEAEAEAPNSLFARNPDNLKGWKTLIRMSNKNLDSLSRQLVKQTASLSAFVSVLGISSQSRVENEVFPELLQRMDHIAAQIRNGNASSSTALTTYDNDDKAVWREFRRDMIDAGIRSNDIHKYSAALKTYLACLQREGSLDEEESPRANINSACIQTLASQSSYSENDSQLLTRELKQIQRNTDDNKYTGDRLTETKDHNSRNADGELKEAEELEVQVMKTRKRVLGLEHLDTLSTMHNLASMYWNQKRWKEAEELGVQVMEIRKRVLGPEHLDTLSTMYTLESTYWNQKRWKEAEELGVQVIETRKKVLGPEHLDTLSTMHNLTSTYQHQKRWKEAEELGVQVIETRKRVLGPEHLDTLSTMHNLTSTYRNQRRWKEAKELEVQVMETRKRVLGPEHPDTLSTMHNLAFTFKSQSRDHEAVSLIENCFQLRKQILGPQHPDTESSRKALSKWAGREHKI
ncbi:MAG: hypothetical protein M1813_003624 [Trichoglossum hirsutum]|nr:MAG: hypothetical protein M1813_003624 [Trichoglossum hirsutum]